MLQLELAFRAGERDQVLETLQARRRRCAGRPPAATLRSPGRRRRARGSAAGGGHARARVAAHRRARTGGEWGGRCTAGRGLSGGAAGSRPSFSTFSASSGVGRSAAWARRTSTMSAAASGREASSRLLDALQQHLPGARQDAERQLVGEDLAAGPLLLGQRLRRPAPTAASFSRVTRWVKAARSSSTTAGSAPTS